MKFRSLGHLVFMNQVNPYSKTNIKIEEKGFYLILEQLACSCIFEGPSHVSLVISNFLRTFYLSWIPMLLCLSIKSFLNTLIFQYDH